MYTTMAVVALTMGMSAGKVSPTPVWENDYRSAMARVSEAGKPMVLIVGAGKTGAESVVKEGSFDANVSKLLASKFVCVYVDTNTAAGRNLADALQIRTQGVVISDKTGNAQAYSSAVALSRAELESTLVKYADADPKDVKKTETKVDPKAPPAVMAGPAPGMMMMGPAPYMGGGCGNAGYSTGYSKGGCCFFGGCCNKGGYARTGCGAPMAAPCGQPMGAPCGQPMGMSSGCCGKGGYGMGMSSGCCGKGGYGMGMGMGMGGCGKSYGGGCSTGFCCK